MGSAQCCNSQLQKETESELIIKTEMKQSGKHNDNPLPKAKISSRKSSPDEPGTPGFAEIKSQQSKRSDQHNSLKVIQFVGQTDRNESPVKSQCSLGGKRKNDSPVCAFEASNTLKSFDKSRLKKFQTFGDKPGTSRDVSPQSPKEQDEMLDSYRSNQGDEKSVKSILKQELKYSKFHQNTADNQSRKVKFQFE